jgi:hypothetical protein
LALYDPANVAELGNGLYVTTPTAGAQVTVPETDLGVTVTATVGWLPDLGQVACTELVVRSTGAPVTAVTLQKLKVKHYVFTAAVDLTHWVEIPGAEHTHEWPDWQPDLTAEQAPPGARIHYNTAVTLPGETVDERVARLYTYAVSLGQQPVQLVADALGCPVGTAAKRVQSARKAGLLPATTPGKAKGG